MPTENRITEQPDEVKRYRFKGAAGEYVYAANFDTEIECHEDVKPNDLEHDQVLSDMRAFVSPKDDDWRMNPSKQGHRCRCGRRRCALLHLRRED